MVEATIGQLTDSLNFSQFLDRSTNVDRLLQQALLWLHDQEVIGDTSQQGNVRVPAGHDHPASSRCRSTTMSRRSRSTS